MKNLFLLLVLMCTIPLSAQTTKENQTEIEALKEKIKTLEKKVEPENDDFKVSIGASFDFNKGASATDLYYDLSFYNLQIGPSNKPKDERIFGLDFKLSQTLLFSTPKDSNRVTSFNSVRLGGVENDSILVGDFSFNRVEELDFTDFGLLIRPTWKMSEIFHLFGHAEFLFRTTVQDVTYSSIDTITIRKVPASTNTKSTLPADRKTTYSDALYFLGLGLNTNLDIQSVNFRIKWAAGVSSVLDASLFNRPRSATGIEGKLRGFYHVDVEIIEKNSGIKLGVNIRDNNLRNNISSLDQPRFSLFISKQFALSKLADFLKSK